MDWRKMYPVNKIKLDGYKLSGIPQLLAVCKLTAKTLAPAVYFIKGIYQEYWWAISKISSFSREISVSWIQYLAAVFSHNVFCSPFPHQKSPNLQSPSQFCLVFYAL